MFIRPLLKFYIMERSSRSFYVSVISYVLEDDGSLALLYPKNQRKIKLRHERDNYYFVGMLQCEKGCSCWTMSVPEFKLSGHKLIAPV